MQLSKGSIIILWDIKEQCVFNEVFTTRAAWRSAPIGTEGKVISFGFDLIPVLERNCLTFLRIIIKSPR
jgi:hypothetical protein